MVSPLIYQLPSSFGWLNSPALCYRMIKRNSTHHFVIHLQRRARSSWHMHTGANEHQQEISKRQVTLSLSLLISLYFALLCARIYQWIPADIFRNLCNCIIRSFTFFYCQGNDDGDGKHQTQPLKIDSIHLCLLFGRKHTKFCQLSQVI